MAQFTAEETMRLGWVYGFCYAHVAARWRSRVRRSLVHKQTTRELQRYLSELGIQVQAPDLVRFSRGITWGRIRDHLVLRNLVSLTDDGLIIGHIDSRRKIGKLFQDELEEWVDDFKSTVMGASRTESKGHAQDQHSDLYDEMYASEYLADSDNYYDDLQFESEIGIVYRWDCSECGAPALECGHNRRGDIDLISADVVS